MRPTVARFVLASMLLLAAACVNTAVQGHLKEDEALSSIQTGVTTQAGVKSALGSPSSESSFGPPTWYYVSSIKTSRALFAPQLADQHVTEIAFDANGVVASVKEYSLKDAKNIQTAARVTPTEGQQLGFFEQVVSNLGRFNNNTSSAGNNHGHGATSGPGGVYR